MTRRLEKRSASGMSSGKSSELEDKQHLGDDARHRKVHHSVVA